MTRRVSSALQRLTKRSLVVAVVVFIVAVAAGASAWALTASPGSDYRTATAEIGNVEQTLDATGTLEPVNTATVSFQVEGQVASVAVAVGQQVTQGQVLAALDTSSLTSAVDAEQSVISAAQAKLTSDEASEADASSPSTTSTTTPSSSPSSGSTITAGITAAQQQLTSDQHNTDTDSAQAKSDLAQATAMCNASGGSSGSSSGSSGSTGVSSTCTSALQQVLSDQQAVSQDEQAVSQDEAALAKLLSAAGSGTSSGSGSSGGGSPGSGSSSSASSSGSSSVVTPYAIASDQATLDADDVLLSEAQTSLDEAQLTSPLTGTVASVGVTPGQNVSADSSSAQIVVIGPQSYQVSTSISVTDVSEVSVGDKANVTLDGQGGQLVGQVTGVGPAPVSSSSTDYPVVISLPAGSQGLFDGASASVSIVVGVATGVVTVPTSAVHELGRFTSVTELNNGKTDNVDVTLGAMGGTLTQVSSGVKAGATIVLANLAEALPTNSTTGPGSFAGVGALTGTGGGFGGFRRSGAAG